MTESIKTIGIIGGDKRQLYLADSFIKDGLRVILGGFDTLKSVGDIAITDVTSAVSYSDIIILPLPSIRSDGSIISDCFNAALKQVTWRMTGSR